MNSKQKVFTVLALFFIIGIVILVSQNSDRVVENAVTEEITEPNEATKDNQSEEVVGGNSVGNNQPQKRKEFNPISKKIKKNVKLLTLESKLETTALSNGSVKLRFESKNIGTNPLVLTFPTSQKYEYELLNKTTGVLTQYSEGKSFLQAIKEETLAANQVLSYDINLSDLAKGDYTFSMWLSCVGGVQTKQTIEFKIEE